MGCFKAILNGFFIHGRENRKSAELYYISGACKRKDIVCGALRPLHLIAGKTYSCMDCRQTNIPSISQF
jgi:hypothetical protein